MRILLISMQLVIQDYKVLKFVQKMFPGMVIEQNVIMKDNLRNLRRGKGVVIQSGSVL